MCAEIWGVPKNEIQGVDSSWDYEIAAGDVITMSWWRHNGRIHFSHNAMQYDHVPASSGICQHSLLCWTNIVSNFYNFAMQSLTTTQSRIKRLAAPEAENVFISKMFPVFFSITLSWSILSYILAARRRWRRSFTKIVGENGNSVSKKATPYAVGIF